MRDIKTESLETLKLASDAVIKGMEEGQEVMKKFLSTIIPGEEASEIDREIFLELSTTYLQRKEMIKLMKDCSEEAFKKDVEDKEAKISNFGFLSEQKKAA